MGVDSYHLFYESDEMSSTEKTNTYYNINRQF